MIKRQRRRAAAEFPADRLRRRPRRQQDAAGVEQREGAVADRPRRVPERVVEEERHQRRPRQRRQRHQQADRPPHRLQRRQPRDGPKSVHRSRVRRDCRTPADTARAAPGSVPVPASAPGPCRRART